MRGLCSCLFILGIIWLRVQDIQTLTTAKAKEQTSARPTTLHKVIEVRRDAEESTTSDIFDTKGSKARRSPTDIWDWDFWCQMQPKTGNCKENITKYYYDAQLDQCIIFSFTGCKGNKNQFDSKVDCERHCKGASYMPIKNSEETFACPLQPSAGLCLGYIQKYYYDINLQTCKTFVYGGCGGNKNRFDSFDTCVSQCGGQGGKESFELALRKKQKQSNEDSDEGFWEPSTDPWFTLSDNANPSDPQRGDSSSK